MIQTIGRASRNVEGKAILYADKITPSIKQAVEETERRRQKQMDYNQAHGMTPQSVSRALEASLESTIEEAPGEKAIDVSSLTVDQLNKRIRQLQKDMRESAKNLQFETAAKHRDELLRLQDALLER